MKITDYKNMNQEEQENFLASLDETKEEVDEALVKTFGPDANRKPREVREYPELDVQAGEVEMCLFMLNEQYFSSREEMMSYIKGEKIQDPKITTLEYIRSYAGRSDVIKENYPDGKQYYLCACDEDGYGIYNRERSNREGKYSWEFSEGSIEEMYAAFREYGITYTNDVYLKIADDKRRFEELCKVGDFFNSRDTDISPEERSFLSSMVTYAEKFPSNLATQFTTDDLVKGIEYVDQILTNNLAKYRKLLKREKEEDEKTSEYAHIQEVKKLVVRELSTYFRIAENFEGALRTRDYIYGYQTYMPDVSQVIYQHQKTLEKLQS